MPKITYLNQRYQIILGYIGVITFGIGLSLFLPLLSIFFYKSSLLEVLSLIFSGFLGISLGFFLKKKLNKIEDRSLSISEGGVIVLISWVIATLLGGLPFIISGKLNFTQGIFEAVSGLTTTGLSVIDVSTCSELLLLWRTTMQFIGGAGLAVIMMAAIVGPLGDTLYNAEGRSDRITPSAKKTVQLILIIYICYIFSGTILYIIAGMPIFDAINHSISAVSTGGFSTKVDSIGAYDSIAIEFITIILMILGTINFASHALLWRGKFKDFFKIGETKFMFLLMGITIPFAFYFTIFPLFSSLSKSLRVSFFEIISAISTTGYSTVSYNDWNFVGIFIMIIVMIIGGGVGSTAGGIKFYRIYILLKSLIWDIKSFNSPKNIIKENFIIRPEGKFYVDNRHISAITSFVTLYFVLYIVCVFILLAHGYGLKESLFEMASCFSTIGLTLGITSPDAPTLVLWTQIIGMFLGRLEFFVVFFTIIKLTGDSRTILKEKFSKN